MAFNIALSGLNAAQTDLDVKGNNIANSSTTGFKRSRTEFGDLYSSGLLNLGNTEAGEGVSVQNTRQLFQQGNVTSTSNGLDMAINGEGFFVLSAGGERQFSRSGEFGVNQEGFITNNQGARVQGFQPDDDGNVGDIRGDLEVNTENLQPKRTTNVEADFNLDAREPVLREEFTTFEADGAAMGVLTPGETGTEFTQAQWTITDPDGNTTEVTTDPGFASNIASQLSLQDGVRVSATTQTTISGLNFPTTPTDDTVTVNGATYELDDAPGGGVTPLEDLAQKINANPPQGITVGLDQVNGELTLTADQGENIDVSLGAGDTGDSALDIDGATLDLNGGDTEASKQGVLDFRLDQGYSIEQQDPAADDDGDGNPDNDSVLLDDPTIANEIRNAFDPNDPDTFNHSTSSTIYDSLGNQHELSQFFVKQAPSAANQWSMYVQIDGQDVGPPDPVNGDPTQARFDVAFNEDGSIDEILNGGTDDATTALIDNWTPRDEDGEPNGADGPNPGGETPLPDPPESSNFVIDLGRTTQVGAQFAVTDLQQDGFATGRLSGLDVTDEGIIQARFTNGESEALGQVALANFRNSEGLQPVGDTAWVETFESGDAVISRPNTGPLGSIQSSAIEESNVDLSEELVGLITAQRNFQANSKTIETSDQITQTIINLR